MAVRGGARQAVREVPFAAFEEHPSALAFSGGRGLQLFSLDSVEYGPESYTPHQFLYLAHDDIRLMGRPLGPGQSPGRLRIRRQKDELSIASLFQWEYPTQAGWVPLPQVEERDEQLGMIEQSLQTTMPDVMPIPFSMESSRVQLPEAIADAQWWIRGRLDFERWLANRMLDDLEVTWKDDRGGEDRKINNWDVRSSGRTIEFFLQDLPPIKGGWTLRMQLVDRGLPAGRNSYLPAYRWYFRRGETWEEIASERVRQKGPSTIITGPLTDMASDGYNLRAERIETVFVRVLCPDLELDLTWIRPVDIHLFSGDESKRVEALELGEGPWSPFQISSVLPPTIGRKFFIGSDLFQNRKQSPILMELEIGFELNGELIEEPDKLYQLQLTYKAEDSWRVVWTKDQRFGKFTFSDLDKEGAKRAARRKVRVVINPKTQLKGLDRYSVGNLESTWLRLELIKASLTGVDEDDTQHPIALRVFDIKLGVDKTIGDATYDQPLPGPRMAQLDYRDQNLRLTRVLTRATGRFGEYYPFFPFVDLEEENQALYLQFDKPLPPGNRHVVQFLCRGEAYLPRGMAVEWELLQDEGHGRTSWKRLQTLARDDDDEEARAYDLARSGVLEFPLPDVPKISPDGFWLRGRFSLPEDMDVDQIPALPPVTHLFLNTVDAAALYTQRTERYSGLGVPHQSIRLLRRPVFLHPEEGERPVFSRPSQFTDIKVFLELGNGTREEWTRVANLLTAGKDDRVFTVDPVEGTLHFGNGIRGRMLPVGSNNVLVDTYRVVPGSRSNVAPHQISVCDGDSLNVTNLLPAIGGRNAETIDEIVRRAPSILTSRDRAVTRADFEVIAMEASGEVSRAACPGRMDQDGKVEVVILPQRRAGEGIPDPFLSAGLRDHVSRYLKRRCLINVQPMVRLADFMPVDVSVTLRLRPNANFLQVREEAERWVSDFLDPYTGGLDGEGWPFGGTLYGQDFARLVTDLSEVRHVVSVRLFDMSGMDRRAVPGWEEGEGADELTLGTQDLFAVRRIRIQTEEAR